MKKHLRLAALLATTILVLSSCSTQKQVRLVLLPDIQTYSRLYPDILRSQTQWAVEHADSIDFVLQQGDMTDHNIDKEWAVAASTLNMMDDKVPYAFVMGNHDLGKNSNKRDSQLFNNYFPYAKYSKMKNFGGAFEEGKMDNVWYTFKAAGIKWLILCLEFGPRNNVLDWAGEVVKKHPHHKVIINTHAYMYSDDTRMGEGDRWLPQKYGLGKDTGENAVNNGEQMWDKLVSKYPNILFVFSGHVLNGGVGTLVSTGEQGNKVYQMLANFQDGVKGTNRGQTGFLRIVDIDVKKKQVKVDTYSPYLKEKQSQLYINHVRGVYNVLERVKAKYPNVPMMLCSGGGARCDYEALKYFTEFWCSDNTDPIERLYIQWGFSQFFPAKAMCAHVTSWNSKTSVKFRTDVASMCKLGFDMGLKELSEDELAYCQNAVANFNRLKPVILDGELYRLVSPYEGNHMSVMYVGEGQKKAVLYAYDIHPRFGEKLLPVKLQGLDPMKMYKVEEINLMPGKKSRLEANGKTFSGDYLMKVGLNVFTGGQAQSRVVELVAQ